MLNNIRDLFEEQYPIGNEIYRDENGSAFLIPAFAEEENQLALSKLQNTLFPLINDAFKHKNGNQVTLLAEIKPHLHITETA